MTPLSVIVITKNEERNISECLASVAWASEIIVVDSRSADNTVELSRKYTDKIFVTDWLGYSGAKNFALEKVTQPWVLWLDADERVPAELGAEIRSLLKSEGVEHGAYDMARRAFFLGKWIRHCGWYPGRVVRLFRKEGARFNDTQVHERLIHSGTAGNLSNDLFHYTDDNLFHYFSKFNRYTSLAANDVVSTGRTFKLFDQLVRPPFIFFKMYFLKLGFLDGMHGLVLSSLSAAYVFTKYAKIKEKDWKRV